MLPSWAVFGRAIKKERLLDCVVIMKGIPNFTKAYLKGFDLCLSEAIKYKLKRNALIC